jgi:hypothetical protein
MDVGYTAVPAVVDLDIRTARLVLAEHEFAGQTEGVVSALHGIGEDAAHPLVSIGDSLESKPEPVDMVLTNPPFGKKSSFTIVGKGGKTRPARFPTAGPIFGLLRAINS